MSVYVPIILTSILTMSTFDKKKNEAINNSALLLLKFVFNQGSMSGFNLNHSERKTVT